MDQKILRYLTSGRIVLDTLQNKFVVILIVRIKIIETDQGRLNFEIADKEAIDCVIQSIQRHLTVMPGTQQEIFNKLKTEFEIKKTEY